MTTWSEFEAAAPELATKGWQLLERSGHGEALLATVREGVPPRIHPVSIDVLDGELWVVVLPSPKLTDMLRDGRYALHSHHDPAAPDEFMVRGHARHIDDEHTRASVGGRWHFEMDATSALFALSIESAVLGTRGRDEWPPRYSRWSAARDHV